MSVPGSPLTSQEALTLISLPARVSRDVSGQGPPRQGLKVDELLWLLHPPAAEYPLGAPPLRVIDGLQIFSSPAHGRVYEAANLV